MQTDNNKYPYYPPCDDEITFYEGATLRLAPQGGQKRAKLCPICNFPINTLLVSSPCQHYFCSECYQKHTYNCGYCNSPNAKVIQMPAKAILHSCDLHCYRVFTDEDALEKHMKQHIGMNSK